MQLMTTYKGASVQCAYQGLRVRVIGSPTSNECQSFVPRSCLAVQSKPGFLQSDADLRSERGMLSASHSYQQRSTAQQRTHCGRGLARVPTPAQLKRGYTTQALGKNIPARLLRRISCSRFNRVMACS